MGNGQGLRLVIPPSPIRASQVGAGAAVQPAPPEAQEDVPLTNGGRVGEGRGPTAPCSEPRDSVPLLTCHRRDQGASRDAVVAGEVV